MPALGGAVFFVEPGPALLSRSSRRGASEEIKKRARVNVGEVRVRESLDFWLLGETVENAKRNNKAC